MGSVQHLLFAVEDVIQRLSAEANDAKCTAANDASSSTSGGGCGGDVTASTTSSSSSLCLTLSAEADSAANLVRKVRRAQIGTVLPPTGAGGKEEPKGAPGRKTSSNASCFRWSDGVLVEALERGDWVVLDGANLCSAR